MTRAYADDAGLFAVLRRELFTAVVGDTLDKMGFLHQFLSPPPSGRSATTWWWSDAPCRCSRPTSSAGCFRPPPASRAKAPSG